MPDVRAARAHQRPRRRPYAGWPHHRIRLAREAIPSPRPACVGVKARPLAACTALFARSDGGRAMAHRVDARLAGELLHVLGYRRGLALHTADWYDVEGDDPDPSTRLHRPSIQMWTIAIVQTVPVDGVPHVRLPG